MGLLGDMFGGLRMRDPVRGSAQVVSCTGYHGDGIMQNCRMQLVVQAEGVPATAIEHSGLVHRNHWPVPGIQLPVTVDRANPKRVKVEWDEVPDSRDSARASAEGIAAAMRGEGGAGMLSGLAGGQVINLSGGSLADLTEEQKNKLRMLGIDPEALAAEQAAAGDAPAASGPAVASPAATPPDEDAEMDERLARLERLTKLRESGALTDAEFEAQKKRILEG